MSLAEAAIKSAVTRRLARSVVVKDAEAYARLYAELQTGMTNAWSTSMREGIAAALDRLRDLGPGKFTKKDGETLMRVLEASVGPEAIRAAMREPVINLTDALFRTGAEEVGKAAGVAINFMRPDLDALDVLKSGNLYWVGNSWNIKTQDNIAKILEDYFNEGMTREGLTQRFAEDFAGMTERSRTYWELLADHTATKTREIGRVSGYERAGIQRVQVRAQIDARTSTICKQMHGRIIEVSKMRAQADEYIAASASRNEPAAKTAWTMHGQSADLSGVATSRLGKGVASPPYHFRCRTITVAYFAPSSPSPLADLRQRTLDRSGPQEGDLAFLRERAGDADFMTRKAARSKFNAHRKNLLTRRLEGYEDAARDLIADKDTTVLLSARVPNRNAKTAPGDVALHAVFAKPQDSVHTGEAGFLVTVVDVEENTILSHHWRSGVASDMDITAARIVTKRKGLWAWLTN